jgi:hypothetical protein
MLLAPFRQILPDVCWCARWRWEQEGREDPAVLNIKYALKKHCFQGMHPFRLFLVCWFLGCELSLFFGIDQYSVRCPKKVKMTVPLGSGTV